MFLSNETSEETLRFDLSLTDEESAMLQQMGLDLITGDSQALINYAIVKILEDHLEISSNDIEKNINKKGTEHGRES